MTEVLLNSSYWSDLEKCHHIYVGYSGGLDSTVLLHILARKIQFASKLTAVHINHGLSPNALMWEVHCEKFCNALKLPFIVKKITIQRMANIEEEARKLRYQAFCQLMEENDCLLLAHHQDDQAETLLLHLFRGTGIDGLAAMPKSKIFSKGRLLRPLLSYSRSELEGYANQHQLQWIDDESNENLEFSRNFLRQQIIPKLSSRWPGMVSNVVRTSEHCQQALSNLDDLARIDCPELNEISAQLKLTNLVKLNKARLTNVLRFWLKSNNLKLPSTVTLNRLISEIIFARADANPQVSWEEVSVKRYRDVLYLLSKKSPSCPPAKPWSCFPEKLDLGELGHLQAIPNENGVGIPIASKIDVRFRQGGESFVWRGQTKQLKKLFQEWHIPTWLRDRIPLVYVDDQLACIVGYAISDNFFQTKQTHTYEFKLN